MTNYCTLADLQAAGRLDIQGAGYDSTLNDLIAAASRWVDRYCKVPSNSFAQATAAVRYYGQADVCNGELRLDAPLLSVTTLVTGAGVTLTSEQYRLLPRNADYYSRVGLLSGVSWGWLIDGEIVLTGTWGMATSCPEPVREATCILASWTFKRYMAGLQDATANFDLGQLMYAKGLPEQVKTMLESYRWVVV